MSKDSVVRARIDSTTKEQAAAVLQTMGLTVSDAVRLLLIRVAEEKQLPFTVQVPRPATIEAMEELDAGKGRRFNSGEELFRDLDI